MTTRRIVFALGAALTVGGLLPPGEAHAQRYSPQISLPSSQAALVRTLLNSVSERRRAEAAELLGETGNPRVVEALATAAAHDTSPDVRRAARAAIRQIRGDNQGPGPGPGPGLFPPPQPQDPNAALVDSWYQRYLGRSVDPGGLNNFGGMLRRGVSADEVQSIILGSDEFYDRFGGNPGGFVVGLYQVILGRTPNRAEVGNWGGRYNFHRRNRSAVAKEFLASAQTELLLRQQNNQLLPW